MTDILSTQERIARMETQMAATGITCPCVNILVTSRGWTGYVEGKRISGNYEHFDSLTDALDAAQVIVDKLDSSKLAQTLGIEVAA